MTNYFPDEEAAIEFDYRSASDIEWPGMWERADVEGGRSDCDPFPDPILERHPRFIVVRDDDEDELTGFSVRGRGQDRTYDDGEYPIYNEPLLRGDALWCELAATALNERG